MTVRGEFGLSRPDETEATIKLTATLADWKAIRRVLDGQSLDAPWQLHRVIGELIDHAQRHFYHSENET